MLKINTFTAKRPIFKQNRAKSPKKCSNLFPKNSPKATKKGKTRRFYPNFGAVAGRMYEPDLREKAESICLSVSVMVSVLILCGSMVSVKL